MAIFRERDSAIRKAPIDTVGLALLVIWVGSLQIMLDKGKDLDWFNSTTIVVLTLVAVIALAFFIVWELTAEHPVVDLSLFKLRNFTGGTVALSIGYGLYFGNLVLLPLWLQTDIGYTATDAGLVMAPVGVFAILLSPVTGKFLPRTDPRKIATAVVPHLRAVLLDALALHDGRRHVRADHADADSGYRAWPGSSSRSCRSRCRACRATGFRRRRACRISCGSCAAASARRSFRRRGNIGRSCITRNSSSRRMRTTRSSTNSIGQMGAAGFDQSQAYGLFNSMATQQAAQLGVNDLFYLSAGIFVALIALIWITKPERSGGGDSAAAASAAH